MADDLDTNTPSTSDFPKAKQVIDDAVRWKDVDPDVAEALLAAVVWAVSEDYLAMPVEQRMEAMGMESRGVQHDAHTVWQSCRPTCEEVWAER